MVVSYLGAEQLEGFCIFILAFSVSVFVDVVVVDVEGVICFDIVEDGAGWRDLERYWKAGRATV